MIEAPQSFIVKEECNKATFQNGFRRSLGELDGWSAYESTTASGRVYLAARGPEGPWYLGIDHHGVDAEIGIAPSEMDGPGIARYRFDNLNDLYSALMRVYALALSLPDGPLQIFIQQTQGMPRDTEAERLVVQRVGQDIFRDRLMKYWNSTCPLTGIVEPALLRASHIKPWSRCESDAERLDVHNGLLLSALWDAAFDAGLVTFEDDGVPTFSPALTDAARENLTWSSPLRLTPQHRQQLDWHKKILFLK
jgi:hypothetical protein